MHQLYVKRGIDTGRGVTAQILDRVREEPLLSQVSVVPVSEEDLRTFAWQVPIGEPLPDLLLEEMIAGETSVLIQIWTAAEITESLSRIAAERH